MTGKLEIDPDGRVTGPVAITYNSPFPTGNGSWGIGGHDGRRDAHDGRQPAADHRQSV